jgi:uncharacterized protein
MTISNEGRDMRDSSRPLAVVTGASSGIGLALARELVDHDFDVVVAADGADIESAAADLRASGTDVEPVQTDLSTPEASSSWSPVSRRAGGRSRCWW